MSLSDSKRIDFEHRWANTAAKDFDNLTRNLWYTFKHTTRLVSGPQRPCAIWKFDEQGRVALMDTVVLVDADVNTQLGMTLTFQRRDGSRFHVTQTPSKPLPGLDVFFWVPGISEVRWVPRDWSDADTERVLRITFNCKTMSNLSHGAVEGAHYISDLQELRKSYPHELKNV